MRCFLEVWLEAAVASDVTMATQQLPVVSGSLSFAADCTCLGHISLRSRVKGKE